MALAERRLGEGRLAQLAGPSDLASDEVELRLGLLRTAQNQWARRIRQTPGRAVPGIWLILRREFWSGVTVGRR